MSKQNRCAWVTDDSLYQAYHDECWGVPKVGDQELFEWLILEGQQAGLNWFTILKKRAHFSRAFCQFDPEKIARFNQQDFDRLMQDAGIIRNRRKIASVIQNAKAYLRVMEQEGSFSRLLWQFVAGEPIVTVWPDAKSVPVMTAQSKAMSCDLKKRGFSFVGPTICYAFMQATGMVCDHTGDCWLAA